MSGNRAHNPIVLADDSSSDEGGMQVELEPPRMYQPQRTMFDPDHTRAVPATSSTSTSTYRTTIEQENKVRARLREERHAALSVLLDRELLMVQALAANETLPQTRRRFLSKLLAPEEPDLAASICAERFVIQNPSSGHSHGHRHGHGHGHGHSHHGASSSRSSTPSTVQRGVVDVCEVDDGSWIRPDYSSSGAGTVGGAGGGSSSSPVSSGKGRGSGSGKTPDKARGKARAAQNQQVNRERERRRRWSGAERDDGGTSSVRGFSSP